MASFLTKSGLPKQIPISHPHVQQRAVNPGFQKGLRHQATMPNSLQEIKIPTSPNQLKYQRGGNGQSIGSLVAKESSFKKHSTETGGHRQLLGLPHLHKSESRVSPTPSAHHSQNSVSSLQQLHPQHQQHRPIYQQSQPSQRSNINTQAKPSHPKPELQQNPPKNIPHQPRQYSIFSSQAENPVQSHMETVKQFQNLVNEIKELVHNQKPDESGEIIQQIERIQQVQPIRYQPYQTHPTIYQSTQQTPIQIIPSHTRPINYQFHKISQQPFSPPATPATPQQHPQPHPPYSITQSNHHKFYNTNKTITNQFQQMFQEQQVPNRQSKSQSSSKFNEHQYKEQLENHNRIYHPNQEHYEEQDHQIVYKTGVESPTFPEGQYHLYQQQYQQQYQQPEYGHPQHQQQYQEQYVNRINHQFENPFNASAPQTPRQAHHTYQIEQLKQIVFGDQPYQQVDIQDRRQSVQDHYSPHFSDRNPQLNTNIARTQQFHQVMNEDMPQQLLQYEAEQRENQQIESQRRYIIEAINNEIEQEKRESHSKRESHQTRNANFMMYLDGSELLSYYDLHQKLLNDKDELATLYQQSFGLDAK